MLIVSLFYAIAIPFVELKKRDVATVARTWPEAIQRGLMYTGAASLLFGAGYGTRAFTHRHSK